MRQPLLLYSPARAYFICKADFIRKVNFIHALGVYFIKNYLFPPKCVRSRILVKVPDSVVVL